MRFQRRYPNVDVEIDVQSTIRPFAALLEGRLDLAIVYEQPVNSTLQFEPLFQDELVVITAPSHRLARRSFIRPEEFGDETLITYTVPPETNLFFRQILVPAGVRPRKMMAVPLTESIIGMVRFGLGVAVLAKWAVQPQLTTGEIACARVTKTGLMRQWRACFVRTQVVPSYITDFIALLSTRSLPVKRQTR
jgi:LysR family transcriptional regulator for metE and metH